MLAYLFDSLTSIPQDDGDNILVFAGRGSLFKPGVTEIVTEIVCTYRVGANSVQFPHNGDAANVRFEQAFSWALKYARTNGIEKVYGVFELTRPLDYRYLTGICPEGIDDRRTGDAGHSTSGLCERCAQPLSPTAIDALRESAVREVNSAA